ncbi:MAG: hypothetical protein ACRD15_22505, partial [Vicinamibacterales bacterium]
MVRVKRERLDALEKLREVTAGIDVDAVGSRRGGPPQPADDPQAITDEGELWFFSGLRAARRTSWRAIPK